MNAQPFFLRHLQQHFTDPQQCVSHPFIVTVYAKDDAKASFPAWTIVLAVIDADAGIAEQARADLAAVCQSADIDPAQEAGLRQLDLYAGDAREDLCGLMAPPVI